MGNGRPSRLEQDEDGCLEEYQEDGKVLAVFYPEVDEEEANQYLCPEHQFRDHLGPDGIEERTRFRSDEEEG